MSTEKMEKAQMIITALEEHLPIIIRKVVDEFYSPESAGKIGKGLAEYYKALRDGGVPEACAVQMVQDYASNLTFKGMGHMSPMGMRMGMWGPMMGRGMWNPMMRKRMKRMWHEEHESEPEEETEG